MKILFLSAEAAPLVKVGGLGDVAGELPIALRKIGLDARLAIPGYPFLNEQLGKVESLLELDILGHPAEILKSEQRGVPWYLVDGDYIQRMEGIYGDPQLEGYKFTHFCLAILEACQLLGWRPDIVHANDWHTAPAVVWLHVHRPETPFWQETVSLLTVHNLAYMGSDSSEGLIEFNLDRFHDDRLGERFNQVPLAMGLAAADWISTVSPTYADQIQTAEFGYGLETLVAGKADRLVGILNGIDYQIWNPATDSALPATFDIDQLPIRAKNKVALQKEHKLPVDPLIPLIGIVSRLDFQKGIDLGLDALRSLDVPWQCLILGTGNPTLEARCIKFQAEYYDRFRCVLRFDPNLARQIYAGVDMILVPSRYEPCGLTQMIGMRYGSVPVVRSTGGLKDTVVDYEQSDSSTGFVFQEVESSALTETLKRAFEVFIDQASWMALQGRAMQQDFSWDHSAQEYHQLYERMLGLV